LPAEALNLPAAQSAHTRSLNVVGAALSPLPTGQLVTVTAVQALPSSALEKLVPLWQFAHARSTLVDGPAPEPSCPCPAGQVSQSAQLPWLVVDVNLPSAQLAHTRSLDVVCAAVWYLPATHVVRVAHTRSTEALGTTVWYSALVHVVWAVHTRSTEALGTPVWYSALVHVVWSAHVLVEVLYLLDGQGAQATVSALAVNWPPGQAVHPRSALAVGGEVCPVPAAQVAVCASHALVLAVALK